MQLLAIAKFGVPGLIAVVVPTFMLRHAMWAVIAALVVVIASSLYMAMLFVQSAIFVKT